jgi:uncharacterized protein YdhG (YjbR/CyaY superfamily)
MRQPAKDIEAYIARHPDGVREKLERIRSTIRKSAPGAAEKISYGMPAFSLNGPLVYFAAYRTHIGFYPTSSGIRKFRDELSAYECSKGTVRFPLDRPVPVALIARIVKFRVGENLAKANRPRARR